MVLPIERALIAFVIVTRREFVRQTIADPPGSKLVGQKIGNNDLQLVVSRLQIKLPPERAEEPRFQILAVKTHGRTPPNPAEVQLHATALPRPKPRPIRDLPAKLPAEGVTPITEESRRFGFDARADLQVFRASFVGHELPHRPSAVKRQLRPVKTRSCRGIGNVTGEIDRRLPALERAMKLAVITRQDPPAPCRR